MNVDSNQTREKLIAFIRETFKKAGISEAIIGVSGGIDSATSLALTVKAIGVNHVYPILLPYGDLNSKGLEDGQLVISSLNIPKEHTQVIDIQPIVDAIINYDSSFRHPALDAGSLWNKTNVPQEQSNLQIRRGNIMARTRMIILFDQAKKRKGMVVGTENKTEHYLGYYTRFGDEASDIEPLRTLYKTEVYEVARALDIPKPLIEKAPTAGLWDGQTDEGEFGFTYEEADEILALLIDQKKTMQELIGVGKNQQLIDLVLSRVKNNQFKQKLPYSLDNL